VVRHDYIGAFPIKLFLAFGLHLHVAYSED